MAIDLEFGIGVGVVFIVCGKIWGSVFYKCFVDEFQEYYGKFI